MMQQALTVDTLMQPLAGGGQCSILQVFQDLFLLLVCNFLLRAPAGYVR